MAYELKCVQLVFFDENGKQFSETWFSDCVIEIWEIPSIGERLMINAIDKDDPDIVVLGDVLKEYFPNHPDYLDFNFKIIDKIIYRDGRQSYTRLHAQYIPTMQKNTHTIELSAEEIERLRIIIDPKKTLIEKKMRECLESVFNKIKDIKL